VGQTSILGVSGPLRKIVAAVSRAAGGCPLREPRLKSPDGEDLIDVPIRRLQSS
jgi:hypothetical protein